MAKLSLADSGTHNCWSIVPPNWEMSLPCLSARAWTAWCVLLLFGLLPFSAAAQYAVEQQSSVWIRACWTCALAVADPLRAGPNVGPESCAMAAAARRTDFNALPALPCLRLKYK